MSKFLCVIQAVNEGKPVRKVTIEVEAESMEFAKHEIESEFPTFGEREPWWWIKLEEMKP